MPSSPAHSSTPPHAGARALPLVPWGAPAATALFVGWLALSQIRTVFEIWPGVSVWYAPAALLATGCILWGWRALAPIVAAAVLLTAAGRPTTEPLWLYLAGSVALKLIYAAGAALLRRARFDAALAGLRDVLLFATFAIGCAAAAALVNTADLVSTGVVPAEQWRPATLIFALGDMVAVLALTPAMLVVAVRLGGTRGRRRRWRYRRWRVPAQALSVPLALWFAFGLAPQLGFLAYALCFLPLGWVALTQGLRGATLVTATVAVGAVIMLQHSGVLPRDNLEVQTFVTTIALAGLLLGGVVDQTERGQALLAESEERYRALVELLPVPLMVHRDGRALFANAAAARTFAAPSPEALVGQSLAELADPSSRELVTQRAQRLAAGEALGVASHRFRRLDGSGTVDLEAVSTPIAYEGGRAALTVARDVTERNRLEHELRHAQRMDAVGRLAGGVAHDFNNLLTVILSYGRMMLDETPAGSDLHLYASETCDAAQRAAALTRQLLAFSRKQVSQPRAVAVDEVVASTETMLRRLLGAATELRVSRGAGGAVVVIDPVQLDQVILNLALNGRDAMPAGGVLAIETRLVEAPGADPRWSRLAPGRYAAIAVRDAGTGIDESIRERIFDPFFTTKEAGRGTGLGLATVYGIVAEAGGAIVVDTALGAGSTFTVLLPSPADAPAAAAAAPPASRRATAGEAARVMVVEDDAAVRAVTRRTLEQAGYAVVEAGTGRAALDLLQGGDCPVDVVVTDLAMPEMNGAALARALREARPGLPVILVSGFVEAALEREIAGLPLLAKPVDAPALVAAIDGALSR